MSDLVRIIVGVFFIFLFITLLPYIGGLAILLLIVSMVVNTFGYFSHRRSSSRGRTYTNYRSSQDRYEEPNIENENVRYNTYGRVNPDVIDVEYTEREEK